MANKKKVVSKVLFLIVVLTLISFCFLGSTFARYVSDGNGTATLGVAKWDVSHGEDAITVDFDKLSPSMLEYTGGDSYADGSKRTNSTNKVLVATISNKGEVNALVTLTVGDTPTVNKAEGADTTYEDAEIAALFTVTLYTGTTDAAGSAVKYEDAVEVVAGSGVLYVFADVTWTSDDETVFGDAADERDTWVGENVTSIAYTISYTAAQNTGKP